MDTNTPTAAQDPTTNDTGQQTQNQQQPQTTTATTTDKPADPPNKQQQQPSNTNETGQQTQNQQKPQTTTTTDNPANSPNTQQQQPTTTNNTGQQTQDQQQSQTATTTTTDNSTNPPNTQQQSTQGEPPGSPGDGEPAEPPDTHNHHKPQSKGDATVPSNETNNEEANRDETSSESNKTNKQTKRKTPPRGDTETRNHNKRGYEQRKIRDDYQPNRGNLQRRDNSHNNRGFYSRQRTESHGSEQYAQRRYNTDNHLDRSTREQQQLRTELAAAREQIKEARRTIESLNAATRASENRWRQTIHKRDSEDRHKRTTTRRDSNKRRTYRRRSGSPKRSRSPSNDHDDRGRHKHSRSRSTTPEDQSHTHSSHTRKHKRGDNTDSRPYRDRHTHTHNNTSTDSYRLPYNHTSQKRNSREQSQHTESVYDSTDDQPERSNNKTNRGYASSNVHPQFFTTPSRGKTLLITPSRVGEKPIYIDSPTLQHTQQTPPQPPSTSTTHTVTLNNIMNAVHAHEETSRPHGQQNLGETIDTFMQRTIGIDRTVKPHVIIRPQDIFQQMVIRLKQGADRVADARLHDRRVGTEEDVYDIKTTINKRPRAYIEGMTRLSEESQYITAQTSFVTAMNGNPGSLLNALKQCCLNDVSSQVHLMAITEARRCTKNMRTRKHVSNRYNFAYTDGAYLMSTSLPFFELTTLCDLIANANVTTSSITTRLITDVVEALQSTEHTPFAVSQTYNTAAAVRTTLCYILNINADWGTQQDPWEVITEINRRHKGELWYTQDVVFNQLSSLWRKKIQEADCEPSAFWQIFTQEYNNIDTDQPDLLTLPTHTHAPEILAMTQHAKHKQPTHKQTDTHTHDQSRTSYTQQRRNPNAAGPSQDERQNCFNFEKGYCQYGSHCRYTHHLKLKQIRSVPPNIKACHSCNQFGHTSASCSEKNTHPPVFHRLGTSKSPIVPGMGRTPTVDIHQILDRDQTAGNADSPPPPPNNRWIDIVESHQTEEEDEQNAQLNRLAIERELLEETLERIKQKQETERANAAQRKNNPQ